MLWPVCLLTGVITVAGVPAAVKDGLFPAVSAPLLLLRLIHCLLLLKFHLLLYFRHQPLPLLFQTLPHLCHCELCSVVDNTESDKKKTTSPHGQSYIITADGISSHQDCASFLTTLADAATVVFLFQFSVV